MPRLPLVLVVLAACSSSSGPYQGEERGPCYPNDTCNHGLECLSGLCVQFPSLDHHEDVLGEDVLPTGSITISLHYIGGQSGE